MGADGVFRCTAAASFSASDILIGQTWETQSNKMPRHEHGKTQKVEVAHQMQKKINTSRDGERSKFENEEFVLIARNALFVPRGIVPKPAPRP